MWIRLREPGGTMTIDELKKLEAEATPAPWGAEVAQGETRNGLEGVFYAYAGGPTHECGIQLSPCGVQGKAMTDAMLIKALRNLAPELIAMWDELSMMEPALDGNLLTVLYELNKKDKSTIVG
jgi:hypothetical protein